MKNLLNLFRPLFFVGLVIAICGIPARAQYEDGSLIGSIQAMEALKILTGRAAAVR